MPFTTRVTARALFLTGLVVSAVVPASGQAVISTRAGVVHYFDGAVYLNDQPLEPRLGRFPSMPDGAELRTEAGRAEVLLTPGVFLRIDQNSTIRMVSNSLADSRVELLNGSAMIESAEPVLGTSVTLKYRNWQIQFAQRGVYRIDSAGVDASGSGSGMGRVWVRDGEAQVTDTDAGVPVAVQRGMDLPLAVALVPERSFDEPSDALSTWSRGRADSISADNQIAANIQDPASLNDPSLGDPNLALGYPSQYGFTQFPMIGLAPMSPVVPGAYGAYSTSPYGSLYPYQMGFYSMYLPGYTYRPLFLGLPTGVRNPTIYAPRTGSTIVMPRPLGSVYTPPTAVRQAPIARPLSVPAARPGAVAAPRAVGHR
jgi:hypothetical protein